MGSAAAHRASTICVQSSRNSLWRHDSNSGASFMPERIVPMIHVPDVNATAQWYASIGFSIRNVNRECDHGVIDWALLHLGQSEIMLSLGGHPSSASRREFDLYIHVDEVDATRNRLEGKPQSSKICMTRSTACANSSFAIATASGS